MTEEIDKGKLQGKLTIEFYESGSEVDLEGTIDNVHAIGVLESVKHRLLSESSIFAPEPRDGVEL